MGFIKRFIPPILLPLFKFIRNKVLLYFLKKNQHMSETYIMIIMRLMRQILMVQYGSLKIGLIM